MFQFRIGYKPIVVVNDMATAQVVFQQQSNSTASRPLALSMTLTSSDNVPPPLGSSPWNPATRVKRTAAALFLGKAGVRMFDGMIENEVNRIMQSWMAQAAQGAMDPHDLLKFFSLNMSIGVTWGVTLDAKRDAAWVNKIIEIEGRIEHARYPISVEEMLPLARHWLPWLPWYARRSKEMQSWTTERDVYLAMLAERFKQGGHELHHCFLAHMREATQGLSSQDQNSVVVSLLSAGLDALTWSMYWLLIYLAQHPALQAELAQELKACHYDGQHNDTQNVPPLVSSVVQESLRYFTVNRLSLPRVANRAVRVGDSVIPEGTMVLMNAWAINRDASMWPNPFEFEARRFFNTQHYGHYAFGAGRRNCPGQYVAHSQLSTLLSALVTTFVIEEEKETAPLDLVGDVVDPWALASTPPRRKVCYMTYLSCASWPARHRAWPT